MNAKQIFDSLTTNYPEMYSYYGNNRLCMTGMNSVLSISLIEFDHMFNLIKRLGLKRGYEIATGFGASSLAIALAMKETGGKLVTMDAYIEEHYGDGEAYQEKNDIYYNTRGYKSVQFLIKEFGLEYVLHPKVGWSPTDTKYRLSEVFDLQNEKLDFVFIDGGHWDDFAIRDLNSILPFLAKEFVIMFHDTHMFTHRLHDAVRNSLKLPIKRIPACDFPNGFFLSYVSNIC